MYDLAMGKKGKVMAVNPTALGADLVQRAAQLHWLWEVVAASPFGAVLNIPIVDPVTMERNAYLSFLRQLQITAVEDLCRVRLGDDAYAIQAQMRICMEIAREIGKWTGDFERAMRAVVHDDAAGRAVNIQLLQVGRVGNVEDAVPVSRKPIHQELIG